MAQLDVHRERAQLQPLSLTPAYRARLLRVVALLKRRQPSQQVSISSSVRYLIDEFLARHDAETSEAA